MELDSQKLRMLLAAPKRTFDTWSISTGVDALECSERVESGGPSAKNAKHRGLLGLRTPHDVLRAIGFREVLNLS